MRSLSISEYNVDYQSTNENTNIMPDSRRLIEIDGIVSKTLIECSDAALKRIAYSFFVSPSIRSILFIATLVRTFISSITNSVIKQIDDHTAAIEKILQCSFVVRERLSHEGPGIMIKIVPFGEDVILNMITMAARLVSEWIKLALKDESLKLSTYWQKWMAANPLPLQSAMAMPTSADNNDLASPSISDRTSHIPHGDPDREWIKYSLATGATEIDRILIEEQVKVISYPCCRIL